MISVDTEIMRQLVLACSTANDSINDAVDVLNRVTDHNDWGCKERNSINEYTNQNKVRIRALQEKSKSFLNTLTLVSHDFENAETSISTMFSSLEGLLGSVIAIPIPNGSVDTGTWGNIPIHINNTDDWYRDVPTKLRDIINDVNNIMWKGVIPANTNGSGYRPGIDVIHWNNGEITGPGYNPATGEGVFHYDENGNLEYAVMTATLPFENYEVNNFFTTPTICNFEDFTF